MKSLNCELGLVDLDILVRVWQKIIKTKNNVLVWICEISVYSCELKLNFVRVTGFFLYSVCTKLVGL